MSRCPSHVALKPCLKSPVHIEELWFQISGIGRGVCVGGGVFVVIVFPLKSGGISLSTAVLV